MAGVYKKSVKVDSKLPAEAYSNKQLTLFQNFLANTGDQKDALSNAIDIWDSIPRYAVTRMRMNSLRTTAGFLDTIEIPFNYRGRALTAVVHPARIEREPGNRVSYYPSAREELIEHALRKIAAQHNAGFHDVKTLRSGVRFSLHQLRKELEVQGHSLRYDEIIEALDIMSLSAVEILATNEQGDKAFARSNYLSALTGVKRKNYDDDRASRWSAQFHPLVTQAIDQVAYRQFNYQRLMRCRSQVARWLLSQLVLKYTQAAPMNTFEIRFSTIRRDSALLEGYGRDRDATFAVTAAFEELKVLGALAAIERKDVRGPRRKLIDIVYTLTPAVEFAKEQRAANRRAMEARGEALGRSTTVVDSVSRASGGNDGLIGAPTVAEENSAATLLNQAVARGRLQRPVG